MPPRKKSRKSSILNLDLDQFDRVEFSEKLGKSLKQMLKRLLAMENSAIFAYPVDKTLYPAYYEQIEQPMDLDSARINIDDYDTLGEALATVQLIWDNAKQFNAPGRYGLAFEPRHHRLHI